MRFQILLSGNSQSLRLWKLINFSNEKIFQMWFTYFIRGTIYEQTN